MSPIMLTIEDHLRGMERHIDAMIRAESDRRHQDRLLDIRGAIAPVLALIAERRAALDPPTVELPYVPRSHRVEVNQ